MPPCKVSWGVVCEHTLGAMVGMRQGQQWHGGEGAAAKTWWGGCGSGIARKGRWHGGGKERDEKEDNGADMWALIIDLRQRGVSMPRRCMETCLDLGETEK